MTERRQEFEMSKKQLATILDACKPVPYIAIQCGEPISSQERANRAWAAMGKEMGFAHMTVAPVPAKGNRFFTAETLAKEGHDEHE